MRLARLRDVPAGGSLDSPLELTDDVLSDIRTRLRWGYRAVLGENSVYRIGEQIFETDSAGRLLRTRFTLDASSITAPEGLLQRRYDGDRTPRPAG
ncbi:MAG: hypothetical protein R3C49_11200 [Planctomycetaceae bacterium]